MDFKAKTRNNFIHFASLLLEGSWERTLKANLPLNSIWSNRLHLIRLNFNRDQSSTWILFDHLCHGLPLIHLLVGFTHKSFHFSSFSVLKLPLFISTSFLHFLVFHFSFSSCRLAFSLLCNVGTAWWLHYNTRRVKNAASCFHRKKLIVSHKIIQRVGKNNGNT